MTEAKSGAAKKAAPAPQKRAATAESNSPQADKSTKPKPGDELDASAVNQQAAVVAQSVEQGKAAEAAAKADKDKEEEVAVVQGNVHPHPEAVDSEAYTAPKEDKK